MSFLHKVARSGAVPIYRVSYRSPQGAERWAYIISNEAQMRAFNAITSGNFNLADYGTIIAIGEGDEPPADVYAKLKEEYGLD
jgi:hypothetical protein